MLGYQQWRNFLAVAERAKVACQAGGEEVADHFAHISKMVTIGSGAGRPIDDIELSRLACYLIAQSGDASKPEIAASRNCRIQTDEPATQVERVHA